MELMSANQRPVLANTDQSKKRRVQPKKILVMNESWSAFQAVSSSATPSRETIDFCYKHFHKTQNEMVNLKDSLISDQNSCLMALTDPGMVMVCLWLRQ